MLCSVVVIIVSELILVILTQDTVHLASHPLMEYGNLLLIPALQEMTEN